MGRAKRVMWAQLQIQFCLFDCTDQHNAKARNHFAEVKYEPHKAPQLVVLRYHTLQIMNIVESNNEDFAISITYRANHSLNCAPWLGNHITLEGWWRNEAAETVVQAVRNLLDGVFVRVKMAYANIGRGYFLSACGNAVS